MKKLYQSIALVFSLCLLPLPGWSQNQNSFNDQPQSWPEQNYPAQQQPSNSPYPNNYGQQPPQEYYGRPGNSGQPAQQQGYPQPGNPAQSGYSSQPGYPPAQGYPPQSGYANPQAGSQPAYPPPQSYPSQQALPQSGYPQGQTQPPPIPGVDLSGLGPEQIGQAIATLSNEGCSCGCNYDMFHCRVYDSSCPVSLGRAQQLIFTLRGSNPASGYTPQPGYSGQNFPGMNANPAGYPR